MLSFFFRKPIQTSTLIVPLDNEFYLGFNKPLLMTLGHTLVVGSTGSGKSVCLNSLVRQFLDRHYRVSVVDFKKVEFVDHLDRLTKLVTKEDDLLVYLEELQLIMESRLDYMIKHRLRTFSNYPLVIFIDEFQTLIENKKCKALIYDLISKCRATNIYFFLSCQAPRAEVIDGKIRDNISNTVIFRCETDVMSEVATGERGNYIGTYLRGNGHGVLKYKGKFYEFE